MSTYHETREQLEKMGSVILDRINDDPDIGAGAVDADDVAGVIAEKIKGEIIGVRKGSPSDEIWAVRNEEALEKYQRTIGLPCGNLADRKRSTAKDLYMLEVGLSDNVKVETTVARLVALVEGLQGVTHPDTSDLDEKLADSDADMSELEKEQVRQERSERWKAYRTERAELWKQWGLRVVNLRGRFEFIALESDAKDTKRKKVSDVVLGENDGTLTL